MSVEYLLNKIRDAKVSQTQVNRKVKDLIKEFKNDEIFIPEYQRAFVWDNSVQSRFVESIFMNIPIPPIFFLEKYNEETGDCKYEIIDGVQRLSTLLNFTDNKLKLSQGLKLSDLERMNFSKLPAPIINIFLNREITTFIIQRTTQPEVQFEIFERLNRGSVALSHQELRNCMFHGNFNNFLIAMSKNDTYRKLLEPFSQFKEVVVGEQSKNRMLNIEMILRFFTLYEAFIETDKYISPKKEQLNFYMRAKKARETNEDKDDYQNSYAKSNQELESVFKKAVDNTIKVFGSNAFRRFKVTNSDASFIQFNKAIFDVQMLGFIDYDSEQIAEFSDIIFNEFLNLSSSNEVFIDAINRSTDHKINERIQIWKDILSDIFDNQNLYRANFKEQKELFSKNPQCSYCNKKIDEFNDSCLVNDEKIQKFSIAHRYCYSSSQTKKIDKKKKNTITFMWLNNKYDIELTKAFYMIVNYIASTLQDEYQIERFLSFDCIGSLEELREKQTNSFSKEKSYKPLQSKFNNKELLYLLIDSDIKGTLDLIYEFTSCFGLKNDFIVL